MELSTRIRKLMAEYSIEPRDVLYCDLIHTGWGKIESAFYAYGLSMPDPSRINQYMREHKRAVPGIDKLLKQFDDDDKEAKRKLKEREEKIDKKKRLLETNGEKEVTAEALKTKTGMLDFLVDMAATPGIDMKTKADLAKQISDLQQFKKEEIREEDNRVHYFLPLTCAKCSLYAAEKERQRQERLNNDKSKDNGTQE